MGDKEIFKNRVEMEYQVFCRKLKREDMETILKNAPRAEAVNQLHRLLIRTSDTWDIRLIRILLMLPSILGYFYREWKKQGSMKGRGCPGASGRKQEGFWKSVQQKKRRRAHEETGIYQKPQQGRVAEIP